MTILLLCDGIAGPANLLMQLTSPMVMLVLLPMAKV